MTVRENKLIRIEIMRSDLTTVLLEKQNTKMCAEIINYSKKK